MSVDGRQISNDRASGPRATAMQGTAGTFALVTSRRVRGAISMDDWASVICEEPR